MPFPSKRSSVNVDFMEFTNPYIFINYLMSGQTWLPQDAGFASVAPFPQLIDANTGYPNNSAASNLVIRGDYSSGLSADFSGPWVVRWDGDGSLDMSSGTSDSYTEVNGAEASATITSGNVNIVTGTQNYVVGQKITFLATVGNIIAGTEYVICSIAQGLTTTNIKISTSQANQRAGTFITPNASGSTTITPKGYIHGTGTSWNRTSNGRWTKTTPTGLPCYVVFMNNPTVNTTTGQNVSYYARSVNGTDGYMANMAYYRLEDEDDYLAGNVARRGWKQQVVSLNPASVRFMNWHGGNKPQDCRFENRSRPCSSSYLLDWTAGPKYGDSTIVDGNQMRVAAVTGTPGSMQHGEVACFRVGTGASPARSGNGFQTVTGITNANPAVTSLAGHGYQVGDWVIHQTSGGMPKLHMWPVKITAVVAGVSFSFANPLGAGLGTFSSATVGPYVSMNVGLRGAYPITYLGTTNICTFGGVPSLLAAGYNKTLNFDKNVVGSYDGNGNPVPGVWLMNENSELEPPAGGCPIEIMVKIINELNDMSVAQGINNPINMWINCPHRGLMSIDPDYSSGSNWPANTISVAFNGNTVNGHVWPGLTAAAGIIYELSNEVWLAAQAAGSQQYYMNNYANTRWPSFGGGLRYQEAQSLRSTCMVRDVKAAVPTFTSRIVFPIGIQSIGFFAGVYNAGYETYYGSSTPGNVGYAYTTDSAVVGGGWGTPASNHNGICIAPYLEMPYIYYYGTGTSCLSDDAAMYNGTDNSGALTITCNAVTNSPTIVTTAVSNGPVRVGQTLVGNGVPRGVSVAAVAGTSPNYTLTLNQNVTLSASQVLCSILLMTVSAATSSSTIVTTASNGTPAGNTGRGGEYIYGTGIPANTSISSVSGTHPTYTLSLVDVNGNPASVTVSGGTAIYTQAHGGNYIGAANQTLAMQHLVDSVGFTTNHDGQGSYDFTSSGAIFDQCSSGILAGSYVFNYEGATNWPTTPSDTHTGPIYAGHYFGPADYPLLKAAIDCPAWWTAQLAVWTNYCNRANCVMPSMYYQVLGPYGQRWAYSTPDAYGGDASHIEGQGLLNNATWVGASARNLAINDSGGTGPPGPTNTFGFSVVTDSGRKSVKMIGY